MLPPQPRYLLLSSSLLKLPSWRDPTHLLRVSPPKMTRIGCRGWCARTHAAFRGGGGEGRFATGYVAVISRWYSYPEVSLS